MRLVWGLVTDVAEIGDGVERLGVTFGEPDAASAICYPALTGSCAPGDRVLVNTTAVDRDLGTGGEHFVVARAGEGVSYDEYEPGHIMKLRYTPLQRDVTCVEDEASPHHAVMAEARDLRGMPVVCCGLHSQLAPVAAAIKGLRPEARVAYVMTDEAALALPVSRLVAHLRDTGLIDATITSGQAFGGSLEAVTLHSALLAARHVVGADVAIVAIGPGIPGTATPFGHGGVAQAEAVNAAAALGGRPIAALRISFADPRERHRGVSHQTLSALGTLALARTTVAVPVLESAESAFVRGQLARAGVVERHALEEVLIDELPDSRGVPYLTMGRTPAADPAFFRAAAAAGVVAAR